MQALGLVRIPKNKILLKYRLKKFHRVKKWGWAEPFISMFPYENIVIRKLL